MLTLAARKWDETAVSGGDMRHIEETRMRSQATIALYLLVMVAVIVAVDVLLLQNRFWLRLAVNVGIVLIFTAFYFTLLKKS